MQDLNAFYSRQFFTLDFVVVKTQHCLARFYSSKLMQYITTEKLELFFYKKMSPPFRTKKKKHKNLLQEELFENKHVKVMVLVNYTSSECALQMYEVSLKCL